MRPGSGATVRTLSERYRLKLYEIQAFWIAVILHRHGAPTRVGTSIGDIAAGLFTAGTEVRRSDDDAQGRSRDIQYIYMRNRADAGVELENEDSWWWFKRNSERVFNDAKTATDRKTEMTVMWNRWRSQLLSLHPNVIAIGPAGKWPLWSWRIWGFYGTSLVLWFGYFFAFTWLHRRTRDR